MKKSVFGKIIPQFFKKIRGGIGKAKKHLRRVSPTHSGLKPSGPRAGRPPLRRFGKAGTLTLLIIWALGAPLLWAREDRYQSVVTDQKVYVDKYFEIDQSGHWLANIYLGDKKIATVDEQGQINYLLSDHLDSVTNIIGQNGAVLESNDYAPFGTLPYSTSSIDQDYKFAGQEKDRENNLQYFINRYYSPSLARFMSLDPMLLKDALKFLNNPQNLNSYSYGRNNPLINIDPNGLETKVFIEKDNTRSWLDLDSWYGHAFLGIDGLIYNWDYNAGRRNSDNDPRYAGEDIDVTSWESYSRRPENKEKDYYVYSFDTDKRQEREIRRFYLQLAENNGAEQGQDRFLYSLFYNGADAVRGALQQGGVLSPKFSAGKIVSTADNLQKALDFRLDIQERGRQDFWQYYKRFYPNKVLEYIIDHKIIKKNG